jgi:hypothetical protein
MHMCPCSFVPTGFWEWCALNLPPLDVDAVVLGVGDVVELFPAWITVVVMLCKQAINVGTLAKSR